MLKKFNLGKEESNFYSKYFNHHTENKEICAKVVKMKINIFKYEFALLKRLIKQTTDLNANFKQFVKMKKMQFNFLFEIIFAQG